MSLAAKEFELLRALIADPTRVFTREELLRDVWGLNGDVAHAHARLARVSPAKEARGRRAPDRRLVINVWGVGYRLCDSEAMT